MYRLPCHPEVKVLDRLDICESEESEVQLWSFLQDLNLKDVDNAKSLTSKLDTIDVTIRTFCRTDYGSLEKSLDEIWPPGCGAWSTTWPRLVDLAFELPELFPLHELPILMDEEPHVALSRRQAACLVVHQFLCTLNKPDWMHKYDSYDFHVFYSKKQMLPNAVDAYLKALTLYLDRVGDLDNSETEDAPDLHYSLHSMSSSDAAQHLEEGRSSRIDIQRFEEPTTSKGMLGLPGGACVIFANKQIGYGEGGTQEENWVGPSPESCCAVLMTPILQDHQSLVIRGAEPIVSIIGYGRSARLHEIFTKDDANPKAYVDRTMIFVDALPKGRIECPYDMLPDLMPGILDRELTKAMAGFGSYKSSGKTEYEEIVTGLWGAGAFGGNPHVKILTQWIASSCLGLPSIRLVIPGENFSGLADELEALRQYAEHEPSGHLAMLKVLRKEELKSRAFWKSGENIMDSLLRMAREMA